MSTVPVTINGLLVRKGKSADDKPEPVVIFGQLSITGLSVGGGPIENPPPNVPPGSPGSPTFPIWGPPGSEFPPVPGYPPVASHPLPPTQPQPPQGPAFIPIWHPDYGWIVVPVFKVPTPSK